MIKPKRITKEDSELFRKTVGKVDPISHDGVLFERRRKPQKKFHHRITSTDEATFPFEQTSYTVKSGDKLDFKRPGIQNQTLRKLRRGQIKVESELDLHGMTIPSARKELVEFLKHCRNEHYRCVRIIHGKGKGSENNYPVLKNNIDQWLPQFNEVLAYCSALPTDGGVGAIYVLLKSR